MKFLRVIRFDGSDGHVFRMPAVPDEWAVSGSFAFADLTDDALKGKVRQEFANGFLGVPSFGRSTFATVADISDDQRLGLRRILADHLEAQWHAPNREAAFQVANIEAEFIEELCENQPINTVFAVSRVMDTGNIREAFHKVDQQKSDGHTRIWDVVEDDN